MIFWKYRHIDKIFILRNGAQNLQFLYRLFNFHAHVSLHRSHPVWFICVFTAFVLLLLSYPRSESGGRRLYRTFGTIGQILRRQTTTIYCVVVKIQFLTDRTSVCGAYCQRQDLRGRKLETAAKSRKARVVSTLPVVINSNLLALYSVSVTKRRCLTFRWPCIVINSYDKTN